MTDWNSIQAELEEKLEGATRRGANLFFRGQTSSSWDLRPRLARTSIRPNREGRLYSRFTSLGSPLIDNDLGSWEKLYLMQHHGLPTRLLDWTENFATALYFALEDAGDEAAVWILDPFRLNRETYGEQVIVEPVGEYTNGYDEYFLKKDSPVFRKFPHNIVAITPARFSGRLLSQRGGFTFHNDLAQPLDALYPDCVRKISIPRRTFPDARRFLSLAGVNHYSLFPDLDGLAKYLLKTE